MKHRSLKLIILFIHLCTFQKLKLSLKKWAESEFKSEPQLNLIPSLYQKLKEEGHDFTDNTTAQVKVPVVLSKDPNVVSSQQEQDDIAKAIELSLKENKSSSPKSFSSPYVSVKYSYVTIKCCSICFF